MRARARGRRTWTGHVDVDVVRGRVTWTSYVDVSRGCSRSRLAVHVPVARPRRRLTCRGARGPRGVARDEDRWGEHRPERVTCVARRPKRVSTHVKRLASDERRPLRSSIAKGVSTVDDGRRRSEWNPPWQQHGVQTEVSAISRGAPQRRRRVDVRRPPFHVFVHAARRRRRQSARARARPDVTVNVHATRPRKTST